MVSRSRLAAATIDAIVKGARTGEIEWDDLFDALDGIGYEGALMFESVAAGTTEDTLRKVGAFPDDFVKRYG